MLRHTSHTRIALFHKLSLLHASCVLAVYRSASSSLLHASCVLAAYLHDPLLMLLLQSESYYHSIVKKEDLLQAHSDRPTNAVHFKLYLI